MWWSLSLNLRKRTVKVFVWSVAFVWKWNMDFTERGYSATWSIWSMGMEAYDESIVDRSQNKWRGIVDGWSRKRNKGHFQKSTEEMDRSHIIEDNIRRTNPREEGLWRTKNNVLGLVTEDRGSYCWIWRSKDVGTRRIKMASMEMKTCNYWQNTTAAAAAAAAAIV